MEERLVEEFIARRPDALGRAYEQYAPQLIAVARHAMGNAAAAEDCVHDALLRVWRTPGSFRPERGSLRAFLIACVRNEAMSTLRGSVRRDARERRAALLDPPEETTREPLDFLDAERVRAALARLPEEQRVAIVQAYFKNRSHSEIADHLGVPLGTIKSRISLALRKLQLDLGEVRAT